MATPDVTPGSNGELQAAFWPFHVRQLMHNARTASLTRDLVSDIRQVAKQVNEFVKVVKPFADAAGIVSGSVAFLTAVGILADETVEALNRIESKLGEVLEAVKAVNQNVAITDYRDNQRVLLRMAAESTYALEVIDSVVRSGRMTDPTEQNRLVGVDATTRTNLIALAANHGDNVLWTRLNHPFFLAHHQFGVQFAPPADASPVVWDYRQALPTYIHAVAARMAYLKLSMPGRISREQFVSEIREYRDLIQKVRDRVVNSVQYAPFVAAHGGDQDAVYHLSHTNGSVCAYDPLGGAREGIYWWVAGFREIDHYWKFDLSDRVSSGPYGGDIFPEVRLGAAAPDGSARDLAAAKRLHFQDTRMMAFRLFEKLGIFEFDVLWAGLAQELDPSALPTTTSSILSMSSLPDWWPTRP